MKTIRAGLYGLIVADALGVPAESRTREDMRRNPITEMVWGGIHGQPAGYWSDDSSMTLCLADSIGKVGYYHTHDIMARFDDWARNGSYTPGGKKFDIGNTCAHAISRYRRGVTPALCGSNKMNENGNGSLMRILPMAFVLYGKYGKDITKHKRAISGHTHVSMESPMGCVEFDEARNSIYINDGSIRPTTLLTVDSLPEAEPTDGNVVEIMFGEDDYPEITAVSTKTGEPLLETNFKNVAFWVTQ